MSAAGYREPHRYWGRCQEGGLGINGRPQCSCMALFTFSPCVVASCRENSSEEESNASPSFIMLLLNSRVGAAVVAAFHRSAEKVNVSENEIKNASTSVQYLSQRCAGRKVDVGVGTLVLESLGEGTGDGSPEASGVLGTGDGLIMTKFLPLGTSSTQPVKSAGTSTA